MKRSIGRRGLRLVLVFGLAAAFASPNEPALETPGLWSSVNKTHGFRLDFADEGVRLTPIEDTQQPWQWSLSPASWRVSGTARSETRVRAATDGDAIEYGQDHLTEWFLNSKKGLLHKIEIPTWELGSSLRLEFSLGGTLSPKVARDGRSITFTDSAGHPALAYRELRATDAAGRDVPVRWESGRHPDHHVAVLRLIVEGDEHAAPITIQGRIVAAKGVEAVEPSMDDDSAHVLLSPQAAPGNDLCAGAEVIPAAGPFPAVSGTYDITDATMTGDPPTPSCAFSPADLSRSVWFAFTPSASAPYTFSLCSDSPTQTTVEDTVLAVYSSTGACGGLGEMVDGCDDDSCSTGELQSVVSALPLTAGATYYVVAWQLGLTAPNPSNASLQLRVVKEPPPPPPPANDQCGGAVAIPSAGPFPQVTALLPDVTGATVAGDPPSPSCQGTVSRSVWYAFTPTTSGSYTFSLCADAPTGTTLDDTVMAIYSSNGACSGLSELPGACDDDSCGVEGNQSVITGATLASGTTYYVVVWKFDTPPPVNGNTAIQLRVSQVLVPGNDTCAAAVPLTLDAPAAGTTSGALNDTELSGSTCFSGLGQTASTAPGGDVAYRFLAPAAGSYSFRVSGYDTAKNVVLYVASDCPGAAPPANVAGCLKAANRNTTSSSEEVKCLALVSGQQVYVYVDEHAATAGSPFIIEANRCDNETEPNGTPATAAALSCGVEGSISPLSDVDFFGLGIPDLDSRVFAIVDGVASNNTGFDMRVTTTADTLEYDDADNDLPFGTLSPNVAGTPMTSVGAQAFLRVSHSSVTQQAEPYRLYATVQRPLASATPESEPNGSIGTADTAANLYFSGSLGNNMDVDYYSFTATAGESIQLGLDLDATRNATPFDGALALLDATGANLVTVNDGGATSSTASGTGSLTATTPRSPGEALVHRIRSSGTYYATVFTTSGTNGNYLLSITRDCRIGPPIDLAVAQSDAPDPVPPGGQVTYTISVTNPGPLSVAGVTLRDDLPAGATVTLATPSQGSCAGTGPVVCQLGTMAASAVATVAVQVAAPGSPGPITNTVRIDSLVMDTNASNGTSSETTTVGSADSDGDGVPDANDCAPGDPSAFAVPTEVAALQFAANKTTLSWSSAVPSSGPGTVHDVARGAVRAWPVGSGPGEACIAPGTAAPSATDGTAPTAGGGYWYVARGRNACGAGSYGSASSGSPRSTTVCP